MSQRHRSSTPDGVSIIVERDGDAKVRLTGRLTENDTPVLATRLTPLFYDVDCLLVDLTDLDIEHPTTLGVFTSVLADAGGWPMAKLALVCPNRVLRQALQASGVARRVAVADSAELARLRCARRPDEVAATWTLPPQPRSAAHARRHVEARLHQWGYGAEDIEAALQVVTELVSNVIEHARTPMRVELLLDSRALRCRVRDYSPVMPARRPRTPDIGGLGVVEVFSQRWDAVAHSDGKTVWAELQAAPRHP